MPAENAIPPELVRYVKEPLAEENTVEIFEDLHYVLDQYIVELAQEDGSDTDSQSVITKWEEEHSKAIRTKQKNIEAQFGALLPHDFVSSNVKLEYLRSRGHAAFASDRIPDDVIEILQEFLEILEYREELDGAGRSSGDA